MSNINRDYLCILDVKTGAINAPKMYFYNTDRSTSNIYVQLVLYAADQLTTEQYQELMKMLEA